VKIGIVVPSSNVALLSERRSAYARHAGPHAEIFARALHERVPPEADPSDDFLTPEILEQVMLAERSGMNAVIVDCMEDPGVEEARRLVHIPVVGPGHAAMSLAALLSYRFSILYPLTQVRLIERLVLRHGFAPMLASIRHLSCGLDGIRRDETASLACMLDAALTAIRQDGAHAIVPACTLTSTLTQELMRRLHEQQCPVPVVEGPGAAVKLAQTLVDLGVEPSRVTYPRTLGIAHALR
jgi:allantoin racemase